MNGDKKPGGLALYGQKDVTLPKAVTAGELHNGGKSEEAPAGKSSHGPNASR